MIMRATALGALALGLASVHAFHDTSPFMFFSTSEILASPPQISKAESLQRVVEHELGKCPSDIYVLANQPGVGVADYGHRGAAPHLRALLSGEEKPVKSSFTVDHVLGTMDVSALTRTLERRCGAGVMHVDASTGLFAIVDDVKPRIVEVDFPPLPAGKERFPASLVNGKYRPVRRPLVPRLMLGTDLFLSNLIDMLSSSNFTVIYTTTPPGVEPRLNLEEPVIYQMDSSMTPLAHMELRRDLEYHEYAKKSNGSLDNAPLFEKYQYFTPGLFMGLLVGLFALLVLYVAISALASLQVSYGSFDKEMGPQAQKKQQ